jgi:hypothetical protein
MAEVRLFSAARRRKEAHIIYESMARFASRSKIAAPLPSSAAASALRLRSGFCPVPPAVLVIATKAAMGAAEPAKGRTP